MKTQDEDTRRKGRRDLLLVLLILPFGILCMLITGQAAIRLAPTWMLPADMGSYLNPNADLAAQDNQVIIEPLNPGILTPPVWGGGLFLTPNVPIPTRVVVVVPTLPPVKTLPPPPVIPTVDDNPGPTATAAGPIVVPTNPGPGRLLADLTITKSDGSNTYTPGTSISYTIIVTNRGPDNAPTFSVVDNLPSVITGLTVNCAPADRCGTNTSSGNNISFTGASLFSEQQGVNQLTITVSGTVVSGATGNLSNTAIVSIPAGARYSDPDPSNNSATDTDTQLSIYDLAITKNDGVDTYTATSPINYTIVVTNSGPSDGLGISIIDNRPPQIASWTWTCTTVINASGCNGVTNSTANFTDTVNIQSGGRIEYSVAANPAGSPQNVSNTASIVIPASPGFIDPNLANNSATDNNIPYIDLQITKTDGATTYIAGGTVTYTITATNASTFNLNGISISDPKPPQVVAWSWSCNGTCTPVNNSTDNFTDTINLTAGSSLIYTVTASISGGLATTNITNTVTVGVPAGLVDAIPGNNEATDIDIPNIDLQITKDNGMATYTPGGALTYTVIVTNNSAFNVTGATVTDNMPLLISSWTWSCVPDPGASCTLGPSTTNISDTINLPAGRAVIYTITATVNTFAVGALENTATVGLPPGLVDSIPGNNSATDIDVRVVGEPDIGPPDGNWINPPEGGFLTFVFSPGIIADGDVGIPDFVFYERLADATSVAMDWVQIEISSDGVNWYQVFYWGDGTPPGNPGIPDTNTNLNINVIGGIEQDNRVFLLADGILYNGTGVTIDVDTIVPPGSYSWMRITAPASPGGDPSDIDAIQPYYP